MNILSGAEEGAQGAPFESYKLAAVRLAEAVRLASRGNDSENVSVEGAGTGEHHMPALPSKGKSRDLSFAASIPVSAYGVVKRLGSPDEEQHALLLFLSDSGNGGRAGSLGKPSRSRVLCGSRWWHGFLFGSS